MLPGPQHRRQSRGRPASPVSNSSEATSWFGTNGNPCSVCVAACAHVRSSPSMAQCIHIDYQMWLKPPISMRQHATAGAFGDRGAESKRALSSRARRAISQIRRAQAPRATHKVNACSKHCDTHATRVVTEARSKFALHTQRKRGRPELRNPVPQRRPASRSRCNRHAELLRRVAGGPRCMVRAAERPPRSKGEAPVWPNGGRPWARRTPCPARPRPT